MIKPYSVIFSHNAEMPNKKMNSKDKPFWINFFVNKTTILIGLENSGTAEFFIMSGIVCYFSNQSQND